MSSLIELAFDWAFQVMRKLSKRVKRLFHNNRRGRGLVMEDSRTTNDFNSDAPILSFQGPFRFLSNFWPCHIVWDGMPYSTVEHAYQAAKSLDPSIRSRIAGMSDPAEAKEAGKSIPLRDNWHDEKVDLMRELIRLKFQHHDLATLLKRTGTRQLVEGNTWGDCFWGECPLGNGDNWLGRILMDERQVLFNLPTEL